MMHYGLNVDVAGSKIIYDMGLVEVGSAGMGPYPGRININEQRKGSPYRIVLGELKSSYRLIRLT